MRFKTNLKCGTMSTIKRNHNETLLRDSAKGLTLKTGVKGGGKHPNHNETA